MSSLLGVISSTILDYRVRDFIVIPTVITALSFLGGKKVIQQSKAGGLSPWQKRALVIGSVVMLSIGIVSGLIAAGGLGVLTVELGFNLADYFGYVTWVQMFNPTFGPFLGATGVVVERLPYVGFAVFAIGCVLLAISARKACTG